MHSNLNIFLISNMYPTKESPGYGSFVKNVCDGLSEHGLSVSRMSVIRGRNRGKINKLIKYMRFYISILLNFFKNYDFIYIHFPNQAIPLLKILYKFKKPRIIVNYHGEDLVYSDMGFGHKLGVITENFCRKYATAIVVPSEYFKNIVVSRDILPDEKIIVSPSGGIDPENFFPDSKAISNEKLCIGYVGRLEDGKGIIEFIETCNLLKSAGKDFKAFIIGYGTLHDYVVTYIKGNGLSSHIKLIDGVPQKELGNYYKRFNLLIFSSSRTGESLGLTGIEAMACGTPIIGSDVGGISSYLTDGFNGYMVPQKDVSAIVDAIERFGKMTQSEINQMKSNCIMTGSNYYKDNVCENLANDIKSILTT